MKTPKRLRLGMSTTDLRVSNWHNTCKLCGKTIVPSLQYVLFETFRTRDFTSCGIRHRPRIAWDVVGHAQTKRGSPARHAQLIARPRRRLERRRHGRPPGRPTNNNHNGRANRPNGHNNTMSRYTQHRPPCFITARFPSTCPETGKQISKGDTIAYYPATRKAYHETSSAADQVRGLQFAQAFNMADANY